MLCRGVDIAAIIQCYQAQISTLASVSSLKVCSVLYLSGSLNSATHLKSLFMNALFLMDNGIISISISIQFTRVLSTDVLIFLLIYFMSKMPKKPKKKEGKN